MEGDTLYVWQVLEADGWGLITAYISFIGVMGPLSARSKKVADAMRPSALQHAAEYNKPVRLARFDMTAVAETIES